MEKFYIGDYVKIKERLESLYSIGLSIEFKAGEPYRISDVCTITNTVRLENHPNGWVKVSDIELSKEGHKIITKVPEETDMENKMEQLKNSVFELQTKINTIDDAQRTQKALNHEFDNKALEGLVLEYYRQFKKQCMDICEMEEKL